MRLDQAVASLLGVSRNRAQFFVKHGLVRVGSTICLTCSRDVGEDSSLIQVESNPQLWYVSRSAQKLADFLEFSRISVSGFRCLDVGASTGWFTQVLLERGATHVVALDVWTAQLHPSLCSKAEITKMENTDIRTWKNEEKFLRITADVSFISLREILPSIFSHLWEKGICIVLFKPQFELSQHCISRTGIPKSERIRQEAVEAFRTYLAENALRVLYEKESTLQGEAWNREVLFALTLS